MYCEDELKDDIIEKMLKPGFDALLKKIIWTDALSYTSANDGCRFNISNIV